MPRLPALNFLTPLDPEEGRHDKIELQVGSWAVEGTANQIDAFRRALASDEGLDAIPWHGAVRWFKNPSHQGQSRRDLKTRTGEVSIGEGERPKLLFSASAKFTGYLWGSSSATRTSFITLRLYMSLTRLMRYQRPGLVQGWQESWGAETSEVRLVGRALRARNEYSLDGEDNWLPNLEFWQEMSRGGSHLASPQLYLDAILSAWESEAQRAAQLSGVQFIPNQVPQINLQKVETYWEFKATDPSGAVKMLTYPLERFTAMSSVQEFPLQQDIDGNARSLLVRLRQGEHLRVYAKTNRRLRFEVVLKLTGAQRFVQFQSHTGTDLSDLLEVAREMSCETLSGCFSYLARSHHVDGDDEPPFRLIAELVEGAASRSVAYEILTLLIHNGRVVSRFTPRLVPSLKVLKRRGVLVVERRFNYVAAARYERGLERLRKEACRFPISESQGG